MGLRELQKRLVDRVVGSHEILVWDTTVCGLTLPVYMALLLGLLWNRVLGGRGVTHAVRHQAHTTFSTKNAKHLRKGCEDQTISRDPASSPHS